MMTLDEALFRSYLDSISRLNSLPLDALEQFTEMVKTNFPSLLDN